MRSKLKPQISLQQVNPAISQLRAVQEAIFVSLHRLRHIIGRSDRHKGKFTVCIKTGLEALLHRDNNITISVPVDVRNPQAVRSRVDQEYAVCGELIPTSCV